MITPQLINIKSPRVSDPCPYKAQTTIKIKTVFKLTPLHRQFSLQLSKET